MHLFDIIAEVIRIFTDLIPRISRRPWSYEFMIVDSFLFGPHISSRPVAFIPILDHVEYWPRHEQPLDADIQTCVTADGVTITVNPEFAYRVIDPLLVRENWGPTYVARICMAVRGAVEEMHAGHNWSHVQSMSHDEIVGDVRAELLEGGVDLSYFCVEERAPSRALRHYGVRMSFTDAD
jgi:hypothetical protein